MSFGTCSRCNKFVEAKPKVPWWAYLFGPLAILFVSARCPECNGHVRLS
jgi:hypothetical protein